MVETAFDVPEQPTNLSWGSQARDIVFNRANPDHEAYHDRAHPRHGEVVAKVTSLYERDGGAR